MGTIIQWATVIIILIIVAVYIANRIRNKKQGSCGCCELNDICKRGKCSDIGPSDSEKQPDK